MSGLFLYLDSDCGDGYIVLQCLFFFCDHFLGRRSGPIVKCCNIVRKVDVNGGVIEARFMKF